MAALKGAAIFVLSDQHEQSSRDKYRKTCSGAFRKLFVEHYVGEQYRHEDTKLVYRNNNACRAVLKRLVVAQPGAAGSKSRECDEQQLALVQPAELPSPGPPQCVSQCRGRSLRRRYLFYRVSRSARRIPPRESRREATSRCLSRDCRFSSFRSSAGFRQVSSPCICISAGKCSHAGR